MRTALTLGITGKGHAEIISHPSVSLHDQRRAFNELGSKKGKFSEIQLWESGRGMRRRTRFGRDEKGGVDFNSAHPVDKQQAKGKKKEKLPDLTPTFGEKGGVNFDSAKPVDQQGKKTAKKKSSKKKAHRSPKTAEKEARATGTPDRTAKASDAAKDDKSASDSDPTL